MDDLIENIDLQIAATKLKLERLQGMRRQAVDFLRDEVGLGAPIVVMNGAAKPPAAAPKAVNEIVILKEPKTHNRGGKLGRKHTGISLQIRAAAKELYRQKKAPIRTQEILDYVTAKGIAVVALKPRNTISACISGSPEFVSTPEGWKMVRAKREKNPTKVAI